MRQVQLQALQQMSSLEGECPLLLIDTRLSSQQVINKAIDCWHAANNNMNSCTHRGWQCQNLCERRLDRKFLDNDLDSSLDYFCNLVGSRYSQGIDWCP